MEKNLTTGSVFKAILTFALPYLLSYFLQTLYGMADLYITGRFCGVDSITAVANGSQVMHMLTVIIVGLAMGSTVIIGHAVGAGNMRDAEAAIGNTVTLFMAVSLGFTTVLVAAVRPLVGLIGVPAEAVPGTVQYLTICFIGIPFITAYNIISSVFRGLGDSKSPMYFIAVACVANISLDCLRRQYCAGYSFHRSHGPWPGGCCAGHYPFADLECYCCLVRHPAAQNRPAAEPPELPPAQRRAGPYS